MWCCWWMIIIVIRGRLMMLGTDTAWRRRRRTDGTGGAALGGTGLAWVSRRIGSHGCYYFFSCSFERSEKETLGPEKGSLSVVAREENARSLLVVLIAGHRNFLPSGLSSSQRKLTTSKSKTLVCLVSRNRSHLLLQRQR